MNIPGKAQLELEKNEVRYMEGENKADVIFAFKFPHLSTICTDGAHLTNCKHLHVAWSSPLLAQSVRETWYHKHGSKRSLKVNTDILLLKCSVSPLTKSEVYLFMVYTAEVK